jgi:hypothetical protein
MWKLISNNIFHINIFILKIYYYHNFQDFSMDVALLLNCYKINCKKPKARKVTRKKQSQKNWNFEFDHAL